MSMCRCWRRSYSCNFRLRDHFLADPQDPWIVNSLGDALNAAMMVDAGSCCLSMLPGGDCIAFFGGPISRPVQKTFVRLYVTDCRGVCKTVTAAVLKRKSSVGDSVVCNGVYTLPCPKARVSLWRCGSLLGELNPRRGSPAR